VNFNLRGAGIRNNDGSFPVSLKGLSIVWTSTEYNATSASALRVYYNSTNIEVLLDYLKKYGHSARLVRVATVTEQALTDGTPCTPYTGNDGCIYPTVKIGTQVWTACNLAETKYRNGDAIAYVTDAAAWAALTTGAYCAYDNDKNNAINFDFLSTNYINKTTAIGDPVPTDAGQIVAKVDVVGGVVQTPVIQLETAPILGNLIKGKEIDRTHIDIPETFDGGFTTDGDGKVTLNPQNSIELSSDRPQLVNDVASPGNTKYYGTNAVGVKGWSGFPYYSTTSANFIQLSDGSGGFIAVNDAYGDLVYNGTGSFTFGTRREAAGENTYVFGNAAATNKGEFAKGIDGASQNSSFMVSCDTTDATPTYMTAGGEWIATREDTMVRVKVEMVAGDFDNTDASVFADLIFCVKNTGGTLTFAGVGTAPAQQSQMADVSDMAIVYDVEIVSDVLYVKVTGKGGTSIRWAGKISFIEINNETLIS
jgi:hypothetical protein